MKSLTVKLIAVLFISILMSNSSFAQADTTVDDFDKAENFVGQSKHALKINLVGNYFGETKITYEHNLRPGRSLEVKGILVNSDNFTDVKGIIGSIGYKFYLKPTFIIPGMKRKNILEGLYFKPEFFIGATQFENYKDDVLETQLTSGVVLNMGKQFVIGKHIVVDIYSGIGGGVGNSELGYIIENGLVYSGGLNFGFAF